MVVQFRRLVAYLRVASDTQTGKQLGIPRPSDQLADVRRYAIEYSGDLIEEYRENIRPAPNRPVLHSAIERAQQARALLVFPHFSHIARDATALSLLRESGVEFVALDNPHANQTALPLLATVVAVEADINSQRAKAVRVKRRRAGSRHGTSRSLSAEARQKGAETMKRRASHQAEKIGPRLRELQDEGKSLREIAATVGAEGKVTKMGKTLTHTHVRRILARYDELEAKRNAIRKHRASASEQGAEDEEW